MWVEGSHGGERHEEEERKLPWVELHPAVKFPGTPAWKPARAGREAGLAPEPAGLGAGLGRAVGRACPRANRPGSRPGPGGRPGAPSSQPAWAGR